MRGMGQVISVTGALIIMCLVFGLINSNFFSGENMKGLFRQVVPILLIGIGQSYVLITGGIDLSIGSVVGMSTMMSATLMTAYGMNPALACMITVACCLLVGICNGLLISKAKLPAFIATLGTMITARGIAQRVNGDMNTDAISADGLKQLLYYGEFLGLSISTWIALIIFIVFAFVLSKTRTGRHTYAIGSNYEAAKLSGVNVVLAETKVYVISAFLASVVGLILTAQSGMGTMGAGTGYELNAVAASVIGGVSTMGGQGLLFGTVVGSFIWGVLTNGLQFAGANQGDKNIIIGIVVVISVLIDRIARSNNGGLKNIINGFKASSKPNK
ncbi:MAG: ABC transporter permease [Clostridiales bacterium]|nr:ABC transporter permease [Clostridiales bacterium]